MSRIFTTSVSSVYPHYVAKVERKGRTKAELDGWEATGEALHDEHAVLLRYVRAT